MCPRKWRRRGWQRARATPPMRRRPWSSVSSATRWARSAGRGGKLLLQRRVVHAIGGCCRKDFLCLLYRTRLAVWGRDARLGNEALQAAGGVEDQHFAGLGRQDLEAVLEPGLSMQEVALVQDHRTAFQQEPNAA